MSDNELDGNECTELDGRDVRALTECMSVLPEGGDVYTVVGENGNGEHRVDSRGGRCTCPDYHYHDDVDRCKHLRRVAFATGERPVPAWADTAAVDSHLGDHVDGQPAVPASDGGIIDAGDDGEILDESDDTDGDDRPEDCDCAPCLGDLPCWPCYRDGFEEPNPNAGGE